ncbi:hypothetical protein [Lewinella sp. 4G2]|nr:hypothetical protein [Lewinella sp. 4G2]
MAKVPVKKKPQAKINEAEQIKKVFTITAIIVVVLLAIIFVFFFNR